MKYMLLICRDEQVWDTLGATERQQIYRETLALSEELAARDLDEAIGIAARIPLARTSTIEIRPVRDGAPS